MSSLNSNISIPQGSPASEQATRIYYKVVPYLNHICWIVLIILLVILVVQFVKWKNLQKNLPPELQNEQSKKKIIRCHSIKSLFQLQDFFNSAALTQLASIFIGYVLLIIVFLFFYAIFKDPFYYLPPSKNMEAFATFLNSGIMALLTIYILKNVTKNISEYVKSKLHEKDVPLPYEDFHNSILLKELVHKQLVKLKIKNPEKYDFENYKYHIKRDENYYFENYNGDVRAVYHYDSQTLYIKHKQGISTYYFKNNSNDIEKFRFKIKAQSSKQGKIYTIQNIKKQLFDKTNKDKPNKNKKYQLEIIFNGEPLMNMDLSNELKQSYLEKLITRLNSIYNMNSIKK